jgi:iron(III) transport system substrate-binding protein
MIVNQAVRPLQAGFKKLYPYIEFKYIRANSNGIAQRMMSESRAGKGRADVAVGSMSPALVDAKLVVPIWSPEMAAFPKGYVGKDSLWMTYRIGPYGISYSTKQLSKAQRPVVYEDLLKPHLTGKMIWGKSYETGGTFFIAHILRIWGKKKANAFFDKLRKQKMSTSNGSIRALLDLVVAGEHAVLISSALHHPIISKAKGAPAWFTMPGPVPLRVDHMMLAKDAPHPHAGMLLIDYIMSKSGQTTLAKANYVPGRGDVAVPDSIKPIIPRLQGKKTIIYTPTYMRAQEAEVMKIFKSITP